MHILIWLLALPVIGLWVCALFSGSSQPISNTSSANTNDLVTGIVIGSVIADGYHHHHN